MKGVGEDESEHIRLMKEQEEYESNRCMKCQILMIMNTHV